MGAARKCESLVMSRHPCLREDDAKFPANHGAKNTELATVSVAVGKTFFENLINPVFVRYVF